MLKVLLKRDIINLIRNPLVVQVRIIQIAFIALLAGGLYWQAGGQDYTNLIRWNAITGFLFFINMDIFFQSLMPVAIVFPLQRLVFLKEQNSKMYSVFSYFLSRNIVQIPYLFVSPAIYILIIYWMVGLSSTAQQFFVLYFVLFLQCFAGTSAGLFFGSIVLDAKSVTTVVLTVLMSIMFFGGFFKNSGSIPPWTYWIEYVAPFKYAFIAAVDNQVKYTSSLVNNLNFDLGQWPAMFVLLGLGIAFRLFSLFFLWFKKGTIQ